MADFTDWASLDTVLPAATECEITVKTSAGELPYGGGFPAAQEWTESARTSTNVIYTGPDDSYSITIERINTVTFTLDSDNTKTAQYAYDWT